MQAVLNAASGWLQIMTAGGPIERGRNLRRRYCHRALSRLRVLRGPAQFGGERPQAVVSITCRARGSVKKSRSGSRR